MSVPGKDAMHDPIFVTNYVAYLLELALGRWRHLDAFEIPPAETPPVIAIRPGLAPTRKRKGRYPSGFA